MITNTDVNPEELDKEVDVVMTVTVGVSEDEMWLLDGLADGVFTIFKRFCQIKM